jgi:putative endonuclease
MYHVYLIKSLTPPQPTYIGYTTNLKDRLAQHNAGRSIHTGKQAGPWELITCISFKDKMKALEFESYLKSGSGHTFAARRLW